MKRLLHAGLAASLLIALDGCAFRQLEELRRAEPIGSAFDKALFENYRRYAQDEERNYDWFTAAHFAGKALAAAYGPPPEPEALEDWKLPDDVRPQMQKAREDLTALLASEVRNVRPQLAADAQMYFDCWVEQQEEGWQAEDIAYCRDRFFGAMKEIAGEGDAMPEPAAPEVPEAKPAPAPEPEAPEARVTPEPAAAPEPQDVPDVPESEIFSPPPAEKSPEPQAQEAPPAPPPVFEPPQEVVPQEAAPQEAAPKEAAPLQTSESGSYIVFFDPGEAGLSGVGEAIVANAARSLAGGSYRVLINTGTDNSDAAKQRPEIRQERAQAVKEKLMSAGIEEGAIHVLSESGQEAPLPPVDRRIEIFISE